MTIAEFQEFISSCSYKPNTTFRQHELAVGDELVVVVTVDHMVRDRDNPDIAIPIQDVQQVSSHSIDHMDLNDAAEWMRFFLMGFEIHEVSEWFKVDGVRPFDPHK